MFIEIINFHPKIHYRLKKIIPVFITIIIALIIWGICYPAFMNGDSLVQYGQALTGNYDDWHPPIMAILLQYVLKLGGGIGFITLIQTVMGCTGIYLLSREILGLFNISGRKYYYLPLLILLILLLPVSPLPFHLMAFIKDTWVEIGFIWIAYLSLHIYHIKTTQSKKAMLSFVSLITCMILVLLVRHNAIVILPVFMLQLYLLSNSYTTTKKFKLSGIENGLLLLLIYFFLSHQIYNSYHVIKTHPENQVYATECLGVLVNNTDNKKYLPYMYSHLTPNYATAYIPGNVAPIMWWGPIKAVDSAFNRNDSQFTAQYYNLIKHAPLSVLKVKWDGFSLMIPPRIKYHWFHPQLDSNNYGLAQNEYFRSIRMNWISGTKHALSATPFAYIFGGHLLWFILNILLLVLFFIKKLSPNIIFTTVLFIPALYCLSYLLASTDPDFRFIYPSTLLMQVLFFSLISVLVISKLKPKRSTISA